MKKTKILLSITIVFYWFAEYVYIPFHTPYILSLGATASLAGVIVGAFGVTSMLLRIPIGILSDRQGRYKQMLILGLICAGAGSVIRLIYPYPVAFLIANLFSGIASAFWVSITVFYTSLFSQDELKKATGLLLGANNGGILLGFIASLFVGGDIGIWFVFAASIAAAVLGLITTVFVKEAVPAHRDAPAISFSDIIKNKTLMFYSGLSMLLQVVTASTSIAFTSSYLEQLTNAKSDLSMSMIIFMAVSTAATLLVGRIRRLSSSTLLVLLFASLGASCVLVPLSSTVFEVYFCQCLSGISNGAIMAVLMTCAMQDVPKVCRSTVMGIFQAIYSIGMTFGPIILGVLVDGWGYEVGYLGMTAVSLAAVAAIFGKKRLECARVINVHEIN